MEKIDASMKYHVLGLGNALRDYHVEVPFEFLEKHGFQKGSMQLVDAATQKKVISEISTLAGNHSIRQSSGGCAANTLAGLANFGARGIFVGKVANDIQGNTYRDDLHQAGIETDLHPGNSDSTGTCLALITPDAERTMLTHLGIATHLSAKDIDAEKIERSDVIYIEGYLWDPPGGREASTEAIKIAKEKGKEVSFTFSDSFCVDRHKADFISLAKNSVDILFCNESEALIATGAKNIQEGFSILKDWAPTVAVTIGSRGALISEGRGKKAIEIPTWSATLVDKLGAGDLFAAGFLYGHTHGKSLKEAGHLGCYAATRVIQQVSARLSENLKSQIAIALIGPDPAGAKDVVLKSAFETAQA